MPRTSTPSPPRPSAALGPRVRDARQSRGITQLALAHAVGRTGDDAGAYVSHIEAGHMVPRVDMLARIAEALGVKLDDLLK